MIAAIIFTPGPAGAALSQSASFEEVYALPSPVEVEQAWSDIRERAYEPRRVTVDQSGEVTLNGVPFHVRAVSHDAPFGRHCGVVLTARTARSGVLAGFVDVPDVRWDYPVRNLERGIFSTQILGADVERYAIILPCLRGHALRIAGIELRSDGDRRDAYDGAADDVVAFAKAATLAIPEIDAARIGVYGSSRGGGVALLAASRSPLFRAVLAFAAPTDFFGSMGRPGTDWAAAMKEAYSRADLPRDSRESQQIEWFFGEQGGPVEISSARRRMLGSSPYYFASNLPSVQVHHGRTDSSVPVLNAQILEHAFARQPEGFRRTVHYHDAGHSLGETDALAQGRLFLAQELLFE